MYMYTPVPLAGELYDQAKAEGFSVPRDAGGVDRRRLAGVLAAPQRARCPGCRTRSAHHVRDFERVLNAYYPTITNPSLTGVTRAGAARRQRVALPHRALSLPVRAARAAAAAGLSAARDVRLLMMRPRTSALLKCPRVETATARSGGPPWLRDRLAATEPLAS